MNPILFYGVPEGCSFGAIVALEWSGLPYQLCRIDMPAVVSSEAFKRVNPVGETPSLRTSDGRFISQSVAILHHIGAASPGSGVVPASDSPGFDRFNEVLSFLNTDFFESFAPLWYALEHGLEGEALRAVTAMGHDKVRKAHAALETLLGPHEWLVGDHRTAADAYLMGIARWNDFHQVLDRRDYPAVNGLCERLQADPAVRFAHGVEHGEPVRSAGAFAGHIGLHEVPVPESRATPEATRLAKSV